MNNLKIDLIKKSENILQLELNQALVEAQKLGRLLWKNSTGLFSLNSLETGLVDKLSDTYDFKQNENCNPSTIKKNILFCVSQPYSTGGHTRLMERLAGYIDQGTDLIITRSFDNQIYTRLLEYFNNIFYINVDATSIEKIKEFIRIAKGYKKIVLNTHPDDIVAIVACGILKRSNSELKIYYVNHADHVFSYGASIADYWFQISAFGAKIDTLRNLKGKVSFLGIPVPRVSKIIDAKTQKPSIYFSSGSSEKFKPVKKDKSFFHYLDGLLKQCKKTKLIIIGPRLITDYWWWCIKIKYNTRIQFYRHLPYQQYLELSKDADIYIDSYPIPGGTAFVEQYAAGKKCIGIKGDFQGYTPIEILKADNRTFQVSTKNIDISTLNHFVKAVHLSDYVSLRFNQLLFNDTISSNIIEQNMPLSGNVLYDVSGKLKVIPSDIKLSKMILSIAFRYARIDTLSIYFSKRIVLSILRFKSIFPKSNC